jgi:hypothetical protein
VIPVREPTPIQPKNRHGVRQTPWHDAEDDVPRGRMLDVMERSAVKVLKRRGLTNVAIGTALGYHRTTVAAALAGPVQVTRVRDRSSVVDVWRSQIDTWVTHGTPVRRMLELAREGDPPYAGSRSAFYARVGQIRETIQRASADAVIRFEGLPGEFLVHGKFLIP